MTIPAQSQLVFATGLSALSSGEPFLVVEVDGHVAWRGRLGPDAAYGWTRVSVPLESSGDSRLVFRVEPSSAPSNDTEPVVLVGSPHIETAGPATPRRVLVWISIDTLRADHLGAYGYERGTSPVLDALTREAVLFEHAMATAPWTLPSLASQFTARLPAFHGALGATLRRDESHSSIFELLAADGFTVLGVTANRYLSADFGMANGFDVLHYTPGGADAVTRSTERALEEWKAGDLALFVHYVDPHDPYQPPEPWRSRFAAADYAGPADGGAYLRRRPIGLRPEDLAHVTALYDGEIAYTDDQIGALFTTLRQRGLLGSALVIVSADHGEALLDHGRWLHGHSLYEELLRVPLLVRAPGVAPRRVSEAVSLADLAPTVLELMGLAPPASFQGRSLVPLLRGSVLPPAPIFAEKSVGGDPQRRKVAVRLGMHKLLGRNDTTADAKLSRLELFDLAKDAQEQHPLRNAARHPLARHAAQYLNRTLDEAASSQPAALDPQILNELRALGYVR